MSKKKGFVERQQDYEWRFHNNIDKRCLNCGYNHLHEDFFCWNCSISLTSEEKEIKIDEYLDSIAKPWKDPESLFCDTAFLKKYIGKQPATGDECKS